MKFADGEIAALEHKCKDNRDRVEHLSHCFTVESGIWRERDTDAQRRLAALEAPKPAAPRVPSHIGAPCEVWDDGWISESAVKKRLWYYNGLNFNGDCVFVGYSEDIGNGGGDVWGNWRELAPVEGGEG
jgi:hypothetical protein